MKKIKENHTFVCLMMVITCIMLIYLMEATANIPLMDYWKYLSNIGERALTSGVSFSDIYNNNGVHHSPLQLLFFVWNIRVFKYNVQLEIFGGILIFGLGLAVIYKWYKNYVDSSNTRLFWTLFICITLFFYSLGQWEILTQEFSMAFAVRQLLILFTFYFMEKYFKNNQHRARYLFEICVMLCFVIITSSAYFVAIAMVVATMTFVDFMSNNHTTKSVLKWDSIIVLSMIASGILYFALGNGQSENSSITIDGTGFNVGEVLKGFVYICGSSVLGDNPNLTYITIVGMLLIIFTIFMIILYIDKKMYKNTYFPAALLLYGGFQMIIIIGGRLSRFDASYLMSSRYACDTKFVLVGDLCIFAYYLSMVMNTKINNKGRMIRFSGIFCIICMLLFLMGNNAVELKKAPYRKIYLEEMMTKMDDIENVTDEELAGFQADANYVRQGIEIMQKNHLGIYKYRNED